MRHPKPWTPGRWRLPRLPSRAPPSGRCVPRRHLPTSSSSTRASSPGRAADAGSAGDPGTLDRRRRQPCHRRVDEGSLDDDGGRRRGIGPAWIQRQPRALSERRAEPAGAGLERRAYARGGTQRIRDFAAANPGAAWIRGRGWNYGPFPGGLPTSAQLDAAVADRPVALVCFDGHSTWVNSRALQAAGITADTPDPANGEITRKGFDAGARRPAQGGRSGARPQGHAAVDPGGAAARAGRGIARHTLGVTSIQNASGNEDEFALY